MGHRPFSREQSSYLRFARATALWRLKILFCSSIGSRTTLIIKQNFKVLLNFKVYSMYYTNSGFHKVLIEAQTYPSPSHIGSCWVFHLQGSRTKKSIIIHKIHIYPPTRNIPWFLSTQNPSLPFILPLLLEIFYSLLANSWEHMLYF